MEIQLNARQKAILTLVAEGKTNQQVADTLHLSENTIKWYLQRIFQEFDAKNRVEAVRLARQHGILPLPQIETSINHNLPTATTSFLGREKRIDELKEMILSPQPRLISICGIGGTGKTRLAMEVAEQLINNFEGGVFFIPLETVKTRDEFWRQCLNHLQLPSVSKTSERQLAREYLYNKHVLLIFDNTEYLPLFQTELSWLLAQTKYAQIISTSRVRLNLNAEQFYPLDGLDYNAGVNSAAYKLFCHVADRHRYRFAPNAADQDAIVTFCQMVEGLPLAIELAATWVDVLSPEQLTNQLKQGLSQIEHNATDRPVRQRSLSAVVEYSWQFLTEAERETLMRLSPLRGSFSRKAALAISGCSPHVLKKLIHGSLLQNPDKDRLKIHSLIRQFGQEQVEKSSLDLEALCNRHMDYYMTWLSTQGQVLRETMSSVPVQQIKEEWHQIEIAWWRAVEQERWSLLENCIDLVLYFEAQGDWGEGMSLFSRTKKSLPTDCQQLRVRLDEGMSVFAIRMYDLPQAKKLANQALDTLDRLNIKSDGAGDYARIILSVITYITSGYDTYIQFIETLSVVSNDYLLKFSEFSLDMFAGTHECAIKRYKVAIQSFINIIEISDGDAYYLPGIRNMLAVSYIGQGDYHFAREQLKLALTHSQAILNYPAMVAAAYELDCLDYPEKLLKEHLQTIINLAGSKVSLQIIGRIMINLGATYISMGFFDRSREMFQMALRLLKNDTKTTEFLNSSHIISKLLIFELVYRRRISGYLSR